jgi:hypothetical protein
MSYVVCLLSYALCLMSCLMPYVVCLMCCGLCLASHVADRYLCPGPRHQRRMRGVSLPVPQAPQTAGGVSRTRDTRAVSLCSVPRHHRHRACLCGLCGSRRTPEEAPPEAQGETPARKNHVSMNRGRFRPRGRPPDGSSERSQVEKVSGARNRHRHGAICLFRGSQRRENQRYRPRATKRGPTWKTFRGGVGPVGPTGAAPRNGRKSPEEAGCGPEETRNGPKRPGKGRGDQERRARNGPARLEKRTRNQTGFRSNGEHRDELSIESRTCDLELSSRDVHPREAGGL